MSCVWSGVVRFCLPLVIAAQAWAGGETRLGNLIRFYLAETRPSRQFELVEKIRQLTGDDAARVMDAIRRGEHFQHPGRPAFQKGGKEPRFSLQRLRIQPMRGAAGDFAELVLPQPFDPAERHPLVVDLGATNQLPAPPGAVLVRVLWARHSQAREAMACEGLVLSVVARVAQLVNVDAGRVILRGVGRDTGALAFYIGLNNPDRFAGVLAGAGSWAGALPLAPNSAHFSILAIERRRGDPVLQRYFGLAGMQRLHTRLRAPQDPGQDRPLLFPPIARWQKGRSRGTNPSSLRIIAGREASTRAFWAGVAPRRRTVRKGTLGGLWRYRSLATPGTFLAEIDQTDRNLIRVRTHRVAAFRIYVDPAMFDVQRALRVSINGGVPIANLIDHNLSIEAVLEDYRERRDAGLLYAASFSFSVRREPARPPQ